MQCNPKLQKTLDLSKEIISGTANLAVMEMGLSIKSTFSNPNIRTVFKGEAGQIGYSVVKVLVDRFIASFGFSTQLSPVQIETLTVDTLDRFSYESLEDVIVFFKMARNGQLGTTKRGVDSNLIYGEWFPKYLEMKADIREQDYYREKNAMESAIPDLTGIDYKKAIEAHKNPSKKLEEDKAKIDELTKDFDRKKLEETIELWSKKPNWKYYTDLLKRKRKDIQ